MAAKPTLVNTLERIHHRTGRYPHECFRAFVRLAACAVSCGRREQEYLQEAGNWKEADLQDFSQAFHLMSEEMEGGKPFHDLLGPIHMEWGSKSGKSAGGEFYTPPALAEMTCRMVLRDRPFPQRGHFTVMEPACGSGVFVLQMAKVAQEMGFSPRRMRFTMIDVSPIATDMAFIQTTLWGIPALVVHGNALSDERWGVWPTMFWTRPVQIPDEEGATDPEEARAKTATPDEDAAMVAKMMDNLRPAPIVPVVLDKKGQYSMDLFQGAA